MSEERKETLGSPQDASTSAHDGGSRDDRVESWEERRDHEHDITS